MERNLSRMGDYCRKHQLLLRPHTKTHKIPELAQRQIASGATGITVAKIGEAEVMLNAGVDDIHAGIERLGGVIKEALRSSVG
jgi:D-serine deaminase-like pyridoxal phosphate-dependent protein